MSEAPAPRRREWRSWLPLLVCFAVLFGAGFLPPDVSLKELEKRGVLGVCMPREYPPLVTGAPERPGFEVELVQEIARRAGWRLTIASNAAMGRDFNPRAWRINRAGCQMVAGGVALSATTRSFMDTSEGHLVTGWAMIAPEGQMLPESGQVAAFYAGLTGLDRIALGQYLRGVGVRPRIVQDPAGLMEALRSGEADVAITEALIAQTLLDEADGQALVWLPEELGRFALGFGFWRGDLTLQRRVIGLLDDMTGDGTVDALAEKYGLAPDWLCHNAPERCRP